MSFAAARSICVMAPLYQNVTVAAIGKLFAIEVLLSQATAIRIASMVNTESAMQITRTIVDKIHSLLDHGLVSGLGVREPGKLCVEAAICYAMDLPHNDDPGCVMPALRRMKIRLNDSSRWISNKSRAEGLRRLAIAQLGSDTLDEREFVRRVVEMTIRTVIPPALRRVAAHVKDPARLLAAALRCEQQPTQVSANEARSAAAEYTAEYTAEYAAEYAAKYAAAVAYAVAYAAEYAAEYAAAEKILVEYAENIVQILIEMKAPGCEWLKVAT
jgi:hypothetical protein